MTSEQALRAALIVISVVVLPIGMFYRIRSQATGESLDRRQEGVFILLTLRPLAVVYWLGLVTWLVNPRRLAWSAIPMPMWFRWMGIGLFVAGTGLLLWTFKSLGPNLTDTVVTRLRHVLVLHGPYRWVRHPLYAAAALLVLAVAIVAANWLLLVAGAILVSLLVIRTRKEEENLVARFGDNYREYMNRTGRFLPNLSGRP